MRSFADGRDADTVRPRGSRLVRVRSRLRRDHAVTSRTTDLRSIPLCPQLLQLRVLHSSRSGYPYPRLPSTPRRWSHGLRRNLLSLVLSLLTNSPSVRHFGLFIFHGANVRPSVDPKLVLALGRLTSLSLTQTEKRLLELDEPCLLVESFLSASHEAPRMHHLAIRWSSVSGGPSPVRRAGPLVVNRFFDQFGPGLRRLQLPHGCFSMEIAERCPGLVVACMNLFDATTEGQVERLRSKLPLLSAVVLGRCVFEEGTVFLVADRVRAGRAMAKAIDSLSVVCACFGVAVEDMYGVRWRGIPYTGNTF